METVISRVAGAEIEWSISVPGRKPESSYQLDALDLRPYIKTYLGQVPHVPYMGVSDEPIDPVNNCFLANGSRLYSDSGGHKETATAEDTSALSIFASEVAAERMMLTILGGMGIDSGGDTKELGDFSLNKRAIDEYGNTWGYHESYCSDANLIQVNLDRLALWGIHLATRGILTGAGSLDTQGEFWIAQKAPQSRQDFANSTLGANKPLVNLRNEQLADPSKYVRLHVISGDPNMSPWASRMKFGCASLVLRLMEHGNEIPALRFCDPLHAVARTIGAYATYNQPHLSIAQSPVSALDAQEQLAQAARALADQMELPEEEFWALNEWEKVCKDMRLSLDSVADRVEWLLKQRMLERYREKHGLSWKDALLRRKDRQWDNIGPSSIGMKLREGEKGWSNWMPPEALIEDRIAKPPSTTRALLRGNFIEHFNNKSGARADWNKLKFRRREISLNDPYMTTDQELNDLIVRTAA